MKYKTQKTNNPMKRKEVRDEVSRALKGRRLSPRTEFKKGMIPHNKGKKLSIEQKEKLRKPKPKLNGNKNGQKSWFNEGLKHPNWNGGTSFIPYPKIFKEKRKMIRNKYNNTCVQCGFTQKQLGYKLPVHHIDFNKNNNLDNNLIPLCRTCHMQTNFNRQDWINYFQGMVVR